MLTFLLAIDHSLNLMFLDVFVCAQKAMYRAYR